MTGDERDADPGATAGDDVDRWDAAGRPAVATVLNTARGDADLDLREVVDDLRSGQDPTPEEVRNLRMRLNWLRVVVETYVAPAAGDDPWGDPVPQTPYGVRQGGPADTDDAVEGDTDTDANANR